MNDLCIGIIICNKDWQLLPALYKQIKERIHINNYRIVCFDNRENQADYENLYNLLPEITFYNEEHKNWYQFEGRRYLLTNVTDCKYWWFIDGDDEVLEFTYDLSNRNEDIIFFPTLSDEDCFDAAWMPYWKLTGSFDHTVNNVCSCLWNKFVKYETIIKEVRNLPEKLMIVSGEDYIYNCLTLKHTDTVTFDKNTVPYRYHMSASDSSCKHYTSIEQFKRLLTGREQKERLLNQFFPTVEERKKVGLPEVIDHADFIIVVRRLFSCDESIIDEALDITDKIYGKEKIIRFFSTPLYTEDDRYVLPAIQRKYGIKIEPQDKNYFIGKFIQTHKNELGIKKPADYFSVDVLNKAMKLAESIYWY